MSTHSNLELFTKNFKSLDWCQLFSEKYNSARLYNATQNFTPPPEYIRASFNSWCKESNKKPSSDEQENVVGYVLSSLPVVLGTCFKPTNSISKFVTESGCTTVNTYRKYVPTTDSKDVSPLFLEYLERLFPLLSDRNTCVSWLAHIFQKPWERPSWHLLLTSDVGTGKGFLVNNILQPLLLHTSVVSSYEKVTGKFSSVLEDNLVVLLDDPKSKSDDTMTRLKSSLSEERCYVEHKGLSGKMVRTYTRFINASNEERPLKLEANERRWYAPARMIHKHDKRETQVFIKNLVDWLDESGSLCKVFNWFMSFPIEHFNPKHVEQSEALLTMIDLSRNALDGFFDGWIAQHEVFEYKTLKEAVLEAGYDRQSDAYLKHVFTSSGYLSGRFKKNALTLWYKSSKTKEEALEIYETL